MENLDCKNSSRVVDMLREAATEFKQTIVMDTHDEQQAVKCDVVIHIEDGVIQRQGLENNE